LRLGHTEHFLVFYNHLVVLLYLFLDRFRHFIVVLIVSIHILGWTVFKNWHSIDKFLVSLNDLLNFRNTAFSLMTVARGLLGWWVKPIILRVLSNCWILNLC
jgi:hypothetical protein